MARLKFVVCLLLVAIGIAAVSTPVFAQDSRGTITGTVRDSSKAIVPGATVIITSQAMGNTISAVTNEDGVFQAPYLIAGTY